MPEFKVRMHAQDLLKVKQHMDASAAFLELQKIEHGNKGTWHPAGALWLIVNAILAGSHDPIAPHPRHADLVDVIVTAE